MPIGISGQFLMVGLEPLDPLTVARPKDRRRSNLVSLVASPNQGLAQLGHELRGPTIEEVLVTREGRVVRSRDRCGLSPEDIAHRARINVRVSGYLVVPVVAALALPGQFGDSVASEAGRL